MKSRMHLLLQFISIGTRYISISQVACVASRYHMAQCEFSGQKRGFGFRYSSVWILSVTTYLAYPYHAFLTYKMGTKIVISYMFLKVLNSVSGTFKMLKWYTTLLITNTIPFLPVLHIRLLCVYIHMLVH